MLILNEPASGLDPRARVEFRNIIKELQRMGKTIIISSHILAELAQLCTHVGHHQPGVLVLSGPVSDVLARVRGEVIIEIAVADRLEEARLWLLEQQGVREATVTNSGIWRPCLAATGKLRLDCCGRWPIASLSFPSRPSGNLEQIFMEITEVNGNAEPEN